MSLLSKTQEKSDEESWNQHDGKECKAGAEDTGKISPRKSRRSEEKVRTGRQPKFMYYVLHGSNMYKLCFESSAELAPLFADLLRGR
jgi:hypothetical protein